jgi:hypothetical protein
LDIGESCGASGRDQTGNGDEIETETGSEPRMELKKGGKFRMRAQDDSETEGTWEWKEPDTIVISYPENGRKVEAKVVRLEENAMVTASVRGRETPYVRLKSWTAKVPGEKEKAPGEGGKEARK